MTTKEQWKAGVFVVGLLAIAFAINYHRIGRYIAQAQTTSYRPAPSNQQQTPPTPAPPPIQQQPAQTVPVEPQYPIKKTIAVNQNGWSEAVGVNSGEQLEWKLLDNNAWLDVRGNGTDERRQFPPSDSRWKPIKIGDATRTLEFRVTPGTRVRTALIEITIRKAVSGNFFANGNTLPSATPSLTDSGAKAGPKWPEELEPTRLGKFPPDGYVGGGGELIDTVFPIEDVLYRVMPGWSVTPFADGGNQIYQVVADPAGFRLRPSNPDNPIVVKFRMTSTQNQNRNVAGQPLPANQGNPSWNSSQTAPSQQSVPPRSPPSYYPTSPTGPSYYPSTTPQQPRRKQ